MFKKLAAATLALAGAAQAQIPIPSAPVGFHAYGNADAPIHLNFISDLMCPYCAASHPAVANLTQVYSEDELYLTYTLFPLPFHANGFTSATGANIVQQAHGDEATVAYMDAVFEAQADFYNSATADMTQPEIIDALGKVAMAAVPELTVDEWSAGFEGEDAADAAETTWKIQTSKGVSGTPWTMVNEVTVAASPAWTTEDWQSVLDPLLPGGRAANGDDDDYTCPDGQEACQYLPGTYECCLEGEACIANVGCRC